LKQIKIALGVAISAALLVYFFRSVDLAELGRQLREAQWRWILIAAVLSPLQIWIRGQRWWYLFPRGANPPGLTPAMMIGYMVNNIVPARAGEVARVYVVARRWSAAESGVPRLHPFWTTLATLVVERVLDGLAVVIILAVLVLVVPVPRIIEVGAIAMLVLDLVGIGVLIAFVVAPTLCARLITRLASPWPRLQRWALTTFETFVSGLDGIRTPSHAFPLILWTIAVWLAPALAAWTVLLALDLRLPLAAVWAVVAFVGLGVSIPSTPGYVGTFHGAAVLALGLFGVSRSTGFGYALLFHASQILPITVLGWLYLLREDVSLGEATHARPGQERGTAG
jgi:glycosyltransferase 2 family protein